MRWSIIRLIWLRELRDQLRDRRTIFMIAVLPILLYPILGIGVLQFAVGFLKKQSVVGILGSEHLPPVRPDSADVNPLPAAAWLSLTPTGSAGPFADRIAAAAVWSHAAQLGLGQDYPPLLVSLDGKPRFADAYFDDPEDAETLQVRILSQGSGIGDQGSDGKEAERGGDFSPIPDPRSLIPEIDRTPLDGKQVDLLVVIPKDFREQVREGRPAVYLFTREGDDKSRLVERRVSGVLGRWKNRIKEIRLLRQNLPVDYDEPIRVVDVASLKPAKPASQGLFDLTVKIFPFLLVMWSLAGALYPAVDLCAGEKERGTMETLLISPASRREIVWGKFLAIWVFSAATALLNLASMAATTWPFSAQLPHDVLRPGALLWCVVLALPLSAFFSALCLAIGAYARSSKEGQYYLMPLFLLTMPLIFLTLSPGVELNSFYSLVPVTGVALLMQRLMMAASLDQVPWLYFIPVLAPMVLYSWLALRWAIEQFQREEVLFREAERLDLGLWVRRLFREKELVPSTGQALFVFGMIVFLRWLAFDRGEQWPPLIRIGIGYLAFVAAPTLLMALLLTKRPQQGLLLRLPSLPSLLSGVVLALALLPPVLALSLYVGERFPHLRELLGEHSPLSQEMQALGTYAGSGWWLYCVALTLLAVACEELAFRGFILTGLRRRYRPWPAILLSSFLFALYHMNVFQFIPAFVLGVILGMLALRTGSILPGMIFHLVHNGLVIGTPRLQVWLEKLGFPLADFGAAPGVWVTVGVLGGAVSAALLWRLSQFGYHRYAAEDAAAIEHPRKDVRQLSDVS